MDIKDIAKLKLKKWLIRLILANIVPITIAIIALSMIGLGTELLFSTFEEAEQEDISVWAENLTDEEVEQLIEQGSYINPKLIPKYVELETKGLPENIPSEIKIKKVSKYDDRDTRVNEWTQETELNLYEVAYPYRLQWKLVAGIDVLDPKTSALQIWKEDVIEKADSQLQPEFTWGHNEYSKKITSGVQYWVKETHDGRTTTTMTREIVEEREYPLPFLKEVEGVFAKHEFIYKEDQITKDTGWETVPSSYHTRRWTTGGNPIYETRIDEEGNEIKVMVGRTRIKHHSRTTWKKEMTVVEEDLLQDIIKTPHLEKIGGLFDELELNLDDLILLSMIFDNMPNTSGLQENLNDIIAITELGLTLDSYQSVEFNPDIPIIEGDWTREDLIKTADSIKGLPYFWGGKYPYKGENENWGKPTVVTSAGDITTGIKRPLGLDCSGFVDWVYYQMIGETIGKGGGTVSQFANTYPVRESELKLGDLGFYRNGGGVHVGIYAGKHNGHDLFIHAMGEYYSGDKIIWGQVTYSYNNTRTKFKGTPSTDFRYFRRPYVKFKGDPEIEVSNN
jgi:hypothetical protein